jgi:hypothetical protein
MKTAAISFIMLICFIGFSFQLLSQSHVPAKQPLLTYVESSTGLASPEWEGGRTELEFADMNGDGNIDIITIGDHGNPGIQSGEQGLMVYFGDGQGNWSCQMGGDLGYGGIAAGDVNNDGLIDVGYAMHHNYSSSDFGDQLIEVALGDGTGTNWTPWDDGLATNGEDWGMFGTDFADFDNDGDLDLGSISFGCCSGIHLYRNNLDGTWTQTYGFNGGNSDMIFQFGDINNDGNADFVVAHESGTAYFGDGAGNFTLNDLGLPPAGSLGRYGVSLGDADNDGGMDLAFTNSNGGLFVYTFNEDAGEWVNMSGILPATGDYEMTQLAYMDIDLYIDLAAYGAGVFQLYLGDGAGNWTADAAFTTGDPGYAQAFRVGGDVDHNLHPDIVLLEEEGTWISYQNHLRCYKESSPPSNFVQFWPVFPHGGELLRPGSVRSIDWISTVPINQEAVMQLEYSTTGETGPYTFIAGELPDNGHYQWTVPQANSDNCYIRYTITSGTQTTVGPSLFPFTISDGTIGIGENERNQVDMYVYPNPASRQLTVDSRQSAVNLVISDIFGRTLIQFENLYSFPFQINISSLQPGMYIIRMTTEDGLSGSAKFLKIEE